MGLEPINSGKNVAKSYYSLHEKGYFPLIKLHLHNGNVFLTKGDGLKQWREASLTAKKLLSKYDV